MPILILAAALVLVLPGVLAVHNTSAEGAGACHGNIAESSSGAPYTFRMILPCANSINGWAPVGVSAHAEIAALVEFMDGDIGREEMLARMAESDPNTWGGRIGRDYLEDVAAHCGSNRI